MSRNRNHKPAEVLLHRDLSTGQQIGMLLSVSNTMLQALLNPEREHENIPGVKSMAGEAHVAAENTFIKVCERLDAILEDKRRWGIAYQLNLEKQYNEQHAASLALVNAQREMAEQQKTSAAEVTAPHFRYKPMLVKLEEGGWAAFLGDVNDLDKGILGVGADPAAALKSFDEAFAGKLSPAIVAWLKQRETDLETGVDSATPFPDIEQKHEVDEQRDRNPEDASGAGANT